MIYLFSQIAISLLLAAITGGAIGWLVHRSRANKQIAALYSVVSKQNQQVKEAQTQVSLLTDDYDDLKHHSENAISTLRLENQEIPELRSNLEKSQLVANQLIQKHKAESAELISENKTLAEKAKLADDREQALAKLRAELDTAKRRLHKSDAASDLDTDSESESETDTVSDTDTTDAVDNARANATASDELSLTSASSSLSNKAPNEDVAPTSQVEPAAGARSSWASHSVSNSSAATTVANERLLREQLNNEKLEPLFEPVDQHDDLKQIFGIGPLTEKTLNKLGITSYSQLADLKQHDIEKIADALHIIPGRIERDNWVGSARVQLEEVLEDL